MNYLSEGIERIKKRDFEEAFEYLQKGYFSCSDIECACYLAQMYFDTQIMPRTKENLMKAMILWTITAAHGKLSSIHKLGIAYQYSDDEAVKEIGAEMIKQAFSGGYPLSACVLGVMNYSIGKYDIACDYFEKYQDIKNDRDAYFLYACSLINKSSPDFFNGIKILDFCVKSNNDPRAAQKLYDIYNTKGKNYDKSKALMYKELQAGLGDKNAYKELGRYYFFNEQPLFKNNNLGKVLEYFNKALPDLDATEYCIMGEIYLDNRFSNIELAERYAAKSLEISRDSYNLELMGKVQQAKHNLNEALEYFLESFDENNKNHLTPALYIGKIYSILKNGPKAYYYNKIEEKYFGTVTTDAQCLVMAEAYQFGKYGAEQNVNLAIQYLEKVSKSYVRDNSLLAYMKLGDIYSENEATLNKALDCYLELVRAGNPQALYKAGIALLKTGDIANSVDCLSSAYQYGSKEAAEYLSEMYLKGIVTGRKNTKLAKEWKKKAEQL